MSESWNELIPPAAGLSAHLSDTQLADVELAQHVEKHLADCAWCQQRRQSLTADGRQELASLLDELDSIDVPAATLQAASAWSLPSALAAALRTDSSHWPVVAPTQLWRLSWRGQDALAVVLERDFWWARVAPVTTDINLADEYSFLIDEDGTTLSQPAVIFMRATATVPLFTLSWFLGDVACAGTNVQQALRSLEAAHLEQAPPPSEVPTGTALTADDWDRLDALDALNEQMQWFQAASHGVLDEAGPVAGRQAAAEDGGLDVAKLLNQRGLDVLALAESTGLADFRLLDLKSGRVQPTPEDRAALSAHFGASVRGAGHPVSKRLAAFDVLCEPGNRRFWFGWHAQERQAAPEDCLVPFTEHLLNNQVAARSLPTQSAPAADRTREQWRQLFRDQLALHNQQG